MARQSNLKEQLMRRFKRHLAVMAPQLTQVDSFSAAGNPALTLKSGATAWAYAIVEPMSFAGFNVVAELSSAAGEGTPEHILKLYLDTDASGLTEAEGALLGAIASKVPCSSLEVYSNTSAPAEAAVIASNLQYSIPLSDLGAAGA
jgi:hypothetical protein